MWYLITGMIIANASKHSGIFRIGNDAKYPNGILFYIIVKYMHILGYSRSPECVRNLILSYFFKSNLSYLCFFVLFSSLKSLHPNIPHKRVLLNLFWSRCSFNSCFRMGNSPSTPDLSVSNYYVFHSLTAYGLIMMLISLSTEVIWNQSNKREKVD